MKLVSGGGTGLHIHSIHDVCFNHLCFLFSEALPFLRLRFSSLSSAGVIWVAYLFLMCSTTPVHSRPLWGVPVMILSLQFSSTPMWFFFFFFACAHCTHAHAVSFDTRARYSPRAAAVLFDENRKLAVAVVFYFILFYVPFILNCKRREREKIHPCGERKRWRNKKGKDQKSG